MEQFSAISRCEYDKTCQLIIQLFDQHAQAYQQCIATNNQLALTLEECEASLFYFSLKYIYFSNVTICFDTEN